jgi:hypothetical protein
MNEKDTSEVARVRFVARVPIYWTVFVGLLLYSVTLTLITGDTGFQADDWWILSVPYWNSLPWSIWDYTVQFRRPLEGLPWLILCPFLGFNRTVFNLIALLLLTGTTLLMGMCLARAFPNRRHLVATSMLFFFLLPTVGPLTYVFHMDNIWMCTLLFWASVLAFQRWSEGSQSLRGLALPVLLYFLSTFAYDVANLLIFLVPLLIYPGRRPHGKGPSERVFWLRLGSGIAIGFIAVLFKKFLLFSGGAVAMQNLFPPFKLVWGYVATLAPYLIAPFQSIPADPWAVGAGLACGLFSAVLLFSGQGAAQEEGAGSDGLRDESPIRLILLACGLIVLGTLPYLMAGYGASLGFHGESRVYSAASFGLAIFIGWAITAWRSKKVLFVTKIAAVIVLGFLAMFHVNLRHSWQEASRINCGLWTSLTNQVPDVAPGTSFLFLNLQSYVGNRAIVFAGVDGLRNFIRIFYRRKDISAYYLYPYSNDFVDSESRMAAVSPKGVVARGLLPTQPIDLNRLLIVARVGSKLVLLDKISAADKVAAIRWEGMTEIRSNRKQILPTGRIKDPLREVCCRWCGR